VRVWCLRARTGSVRSGRETRGRRRGASLGWASRGSRSSGGMAWGEAKLEVKLRVGGGRGLRAAR
jgi:hypothetical protein